MIFGVKYLLQKYIVQILNFAVHKHSPIIT